jgi:hypothetical protein
VSPDRLRSKNTLPDMDSPKLAPIGELEEGITPTYKGIPCDAGASQATSNEIDAFGDKGDSRIPPGKPFPNFRSQRFPSPRDDNIIPFSRVSQIWISGVRAATGCKRRYMNSEHPMKRTLTTLPISCGVPGSIGSHGELLILSVRD